MNKNKELKRILEQYKSDDYGYFIKKKPDGTSYTYKEVQKMYEENSPNVRKITVKDLPRIINLIKEYYGLK